MKSMLVLFACVAACMAQQYQQYQQQQYQQQQPQYYQQQRSAEAAAPILRQSAEVNPDGSYQFAYETGNGISAGENGVGGVAANGYQQWTSPEGIPIQIQYRADENGYQPTGNAIPTPPPVPEAILRALEWIRTHPSNDDGQYRAQPVYQQQQQRFF